MWCASVTQAMTEEAALVRGEHFDEKLDDTAGRVEFPAFLAFGAGEFA